MLTEFFFQCSENEFTCNNGTCIELTKRCDDIFDCNDEKNHNYQFTPLARLKATETT